MQFCFVQHPQQNCQSIEDDLNQQTKKKQNNNKKQIKTTNKQTHKQANDTLVSLSMYAMA